MKKSRICKRKEVRKLRKHIAWVCACGSHNNSSCTQARGRHAIKRNRQLLG
jgi:hypothetical protein